jgi:phosphoribosyl 1,2-cyclic phosphodiesterase
MSLNFISLSSGSSGNCYYLGNDFHGILIDAGLSGSAIRKALKNSGISLQTILGVLITHNHTDHIKGLYQLTKKRSIPAFSTLKIWESIHSLGIVIPGDCIRKIGLQQKFRIGSFEIEAFPVSHDAPETVGYHIISDNKKFAVATDLGHISPVVASYLGSANLLVIESNYDEQMLMEGDYPAYLKNRIRSNTGHLGNHQTSAFIAENFSEQIDHICLAHLSKNNNTPALALRALNEALQKKGIILNGKQGISILNRDIPSGTIRITA